MKSALFVLNSTSQLTTHAAKLAAADLIVCDPSMDVPAIRAVAPSASLCAYFRADAVFGGGLDNAFHNATRTLMLRYTYAPAIPGHPADRLIKPSFQSAEDYARHMVACVNAGGWDRVYLDQSWKTKPPYLANLELPFYATGQAPEQTAAEVQWRWRGYLESIVGILADEEIPVVSNCGADPVRLASSMFVPCAEIDDVTSEDAAAPDLIDFAGVRPRYPGILWGSTFAVDDLFIRGEYLTATAPGGEGEL